MFNLLGGLCIVFGIVDYAAARFFETDITGYHYSPFIAWIVGILLMKFGPKGDDSGDEA